MVNGKRQASDRTYDRVLYGANSREGIGGNLIAKTNQDSFFCYEGLYEDALVFGVFDGHGPQGEFASQAAASLLPSSLAKHAGMNGELDEDAFAAAFVEVDRLMHENREGYDVHGSGCTATVVSKQGSRLQCANAGDSRCLVGSVDPASGRVRARPMSVDHTPEVPAEKTRVLMSGGRIDRLVIRGVEEGPLRVYLWNAESPGITVTRSFGDRQYRGVGLTPVPEVTDCVIGPQDRYIVVCSDGITEFFEDEEIIQMVHNGACQKMPPSVIASQIVEEARRVWQKRENGISDDCTMVIGILQGGTSSGNDGAAPLTPEPPDSPVRSGKSHTSTGMWALMPPSPTPRERASLDRTARPAASGASGSRAFSKSIDLSDAMRARKLAELSGGGSPASTGPVEGSRPGGSRGGLLNGLMNRFGPRSGASKDADGGEGVLRTESGQPTHTNAGSPAPLPRNLSTPGELGLARGGFSRGTPPLSPGPSHLNDSLVNLPNIRKSGNFGPASPLSLARASPGPPSPAQPSPVGARQASGTGPAGHSRAQMGVTLTGTLGATLQSINAMRTQASALRTPTTSGPSSAPLTEAMGAKSGLSPSPNSGRLGLAAASPGASPLASRGGVAFSPMGSGDIRRSYDLSSRAAGYPPPSPVAATVPPHARGKSVDMSRLAVSEMSAPRSDGKTVRR